MAYEVIKRRGKRAYRYTVEYYHDESGKGRTRWQYVGPVDPHDERAAPPSRIPKKSSPDTAGRLLDALERLLARAEYAEVTASAIAVEAAVAHGTFYRHFKDKRDALRAAMFRLSERAEHLAQLSDPGPDRERERVRLREWIVQKLATMSEYPTVWRAWAALSESDASYGEIRQNARVKYRAILKCYLDRLREQGHTNITDTESLSALILTLMYGVLQDRFAYKNGTPSPAIIDQVCLMIDRTVFSTAPIDPQLHAQFAATEKPGGIFAAR